MSFRALFIEDKEKQFIINLRTQLYFMEVEYERRQILQTYATRLISK